MSEKAKILMQRLEEWQLTHEPEKRAMGFIKSTQYHYVQGNK